MKECSPCRLCPWCWCRGSHCGQWVTESQVELAGQGYGRKCSAAQSRPPGRNSAPKCHSLQCFSPVRDKDNKKRWGQVLDRREREHCFPLMGIFLMKTKLRQNWKYAEKNGNKRICSSSWNYQLPTENFTIFHLLVVLPHWNQSLKVIPVRTISQIYTIYHKIMLSRTLLKNICCRTMFTWSLCRRGNRKNKNRITQCYPKHRKVPFPWGSKEERFQSYGLKDKS